MENEEEDGAAVGADGPDAGVLTDRERRELAVWVETALVLVPEQHHLCVGRCAQGEENSSRDRLRPWTVSVGPAVVAGKADEAEAHVYRLILVAHGARKTTAPPWPSPAGTGPQILFIAHGLPGSREA